MSWKAKEQEALDGYHRKFAGEIEKAILDLYISHGRPLKVDEIAAYVRLQDKD